MLDWYGFKVYESNIPKSRAGVYVLLNLENGKHYVGESGNIKARLQSHATGGSPRKLKNALNKYGLHNFLVMPVWYATTIEPDKTYLLFVETSLIDDFDSIKSGYNILNQYNRSNWGWADPDNPPDRSWHREFIGKIWNDPIAGPKLRAIAADPEFQKRRGDAVKAAYDKPGGKDKLMESKNETWRAGVIAGLKKYYADPENRQKASDNQARVADKHAQSLTDAWQRNPRCWITDGISNRQHFVNLPIPEGWYRGRSGLLGRALANSRQELN